MALPVPNLDDRRFQDLVDDAKRLELMGVRLFPPTAARAPITFWLSGPQPDTVTVRAGTQVATLRTENDEAITFTTVADLPIIPCALERVASVLAGDKQVSDHTAALEART